MTELTVGGDSALEYHRVGRRGDSDPTVLSWRSFWLVIRLIDLHGETGRARTTSDLIDFRTKTKLEPGSLLVLFWRVGETARMEGGEIKGNPCLLVELDRSRPISSSTGNSRNGRGCRTHALDFRVAQKEFDSLGFEQRGRLCQLPS
jgi:hypothetical protein